MTGFIALDAFLFGIITTIPLPIGSLSSFKVDTKTKDSGIV